jgi:zinc D-Ala-D-Ala carboxypeptidase
MDWKKIKYFKKEEFDCKCGCGRNEMQEQFMLMLDDARDMAGVPFKINSGYRCPEHDQEEGGKGNHTTGNAVDIQVTSSRARYKILQAAFEENFGRIGIGRTFIHLDDNAEDNDKPTEVSWLYD